MSSIIYLFFCSISMFIPSQVEKPESKYFKNLKPIVKRIHPQAIKQEILYRKVPFKMIKNSKNSI